MVDFGGCQPILRVEDMGVSLRFYDEQLGFRSAPWGDEWFTFVQRGRAGIYLCQRHQGLGQAWAYVGVSDVLALHEEFLGRGVVIRLPPTNYSWGLEMHVEDPDGNVLRFGSDPLDDRPLVAWVETAPAPNRP